MGQYYQIINGQRYNASLIRNAAFRTRGAGDGRISLQNAQDLWQLAMDGGRITEIEEATIAYLLEAFNWTEAASEWMQAELAKQVEEIKSYYRVIDGLRYDRKVLEEADARTQGQGDGRISQDDAEFLLPLFGDFGDVTIIEERTLQYLLENYNWTAAAESWFLERVTRISRQSQVAGLLIAIMKHEFEFERLSLAYFEDEALQQMLDFDNKVSLPDALRKAIDNLYNYNETGSLASMLPNYTSDPVKDFIEGGRLVLLPGDMDSEPTFLSFPTPLNGESLSTNWIFGLELYDLTDDIYWVIVPRDGQGQVYNYIGGANVEDEWPRSGGEAYFFVEVKSCDLPYPGITVDIQDPDGNYIIGKSDNAGRVRVTGRAGLYSIFASDGWSSQSKSFDWDGEGTDQVRAVVLDC